MDSLHRLVPAGFQRAGHQAVLRLNLSILPRASVRFVACALQFHFDLPLLLRPARRELGGGLQHGLHAGRRECVEHRFHNGLLDRHATEDATELLADRLALCRYTVVIHDQRVTTTAATVPDAHLSSTSAATHQSGQQTFARTSRTRYGLAQRTPVLLQPFLIRQVLWPRDVTLVVVLKEHLPLIRPPLPFLHLSFPSLFQDDASTRAAERIDARVCRVLEEPRDPPGGRGNKVHRIREGRPAPGQRDFFLAKP